MESVQKIGQERLPERIEEPIENTPVPRSICYSAPAPTIEDTSPAVPASEYVAPAPVIEHVEPAPLIENHRASTTSGQLIAQSVVTSSIHHGHNPAWRARDVLPLNLKLANLVFDMFGKSCEVIRIGTGPHPIGPDQGSTPWKNVDDLSRATGCDAATSTSGHDAKRRRLLYEVAQLTFISP